MNDKLFIINEDDSSEPYAIIIQTNDDLLLAKIGAIKGVEFRQKIKSSLVKFIRQQCKEFTGNENSVYMSQDSYLWLSIDDINLFDHLKKNLEIINRVEIINVIFSKNDINDEIDNKFNYYLLENELIYNKEEKKRLKL